MKLKQVIRYANAPALEATWVRYDQLPDVEVPASPAPYDKDGNEEQAPVEAHTRPGEVIETVLKCHAYSHHPEQMAMLRADLGDDATEYEALIAEVEATYVLPEPEATIAPKTCSPTQGLVALYALKQITEADVNTAIAGIPDVAQRYTAQIAFARATEWRRDSAVVQMLAALLGLTEQELDELFAFAVTVEV